MRVCPPSTATWQTPRPGACVWEDDRGVFTLVPGSTIQAQDGCGRVCLSGWGVVTRRSRGHWAKDGLTGLGLDGGSMTWTGA